jgi:imidazolonepropionase-like amidohydrolase
MRRTSYIAIVLSAAFLAASLIGGLASAQETKLEIPRVVVIKNVNVWDGSGEATKDVDVLVVGNKIRKVAKDIPTEGAYEVDALRKRFTKVRNPFPTERGLNLSVVGEQGTVEKIKVDVDVIDGKGGYLIPGLMDSHQHVMMSPTSGPPQFINEKSPYLLAYESVPHVKKMLMKGLTTVRDVGGPALDLAKAIDAGLIDGPRIVSAGAFISCTSGHGDFRNNNSPALRHLGSAKRQADFGWSHLADGPAEVRAATRQVLSTGAANIKIMAGGGVASLKDPLESIGFSEAEMRAAVEAAADYDTYVMAHAYNDESMQRAIRAGVKDIVHGHLCSEKTIKMMAEHGVWLGSLSKPQGLMDVPFFTDENRRKGRRVLDGYDLVMRLARMHKVKMGFGTDAASSMADLILFEFKERSKYFTPVEMLKQATVNNAELIAMCNSRNPYKEAPLGVIKEGAWADMLIYGANPLDDISVVIEYENNLKFIMKDGKVYKNTLK